ncbi:3'(2'),5'-bisphosphate nucleotidase 1-like isoform X2 [Dreissena polymorpha]|uniref:3'(2'),5'-bisphosphate nucleotidase 1-like isoform X2 n=1 Tax=Dreissena polymorpha TaxID=45954 RepID=UPI002263C01A|nr:3'(2'),5'-bisphosphate nucleotidase 1-like isoform X2 [Dreissena polymorpha]
MAVSESVPLLMRLVSASVSVSYRAARIARDVLIKGDLGIVDKGGKNDLQTEADRSAQRCIIASLHKQFPNVAIFGEEDLAPTTKIPDDFIETEFDQDVLRHECPENLRNINNDDVVIWVDPLDGTKEFTEGFLDHVTVLIGIAVKGVATAGVINQPFHNFEEIPKYGKARCIWGVQGLGSFGFKRNAHLEGNVITTTRSHSDYTITKTVEACEPTEVLRVGGAGHKVLLLIEKKAHAYVFASIGCKKWDTCAPEAILQSLGGRLTDIHGHPIPYHANVVHNNTGGVLATVANHDWYVNKIKEKVDSETLSKFESVKAAPPSLESQLSQQTLNIQNSSSKSANGKVGEEKTRKSEVNKATHKK